MKINFINNTDGGTLNFEELITKVLKKKSRFKQLNIIFVSEEEIQKINKEFRKKDYVTDVISFPNNNKELGDIFICINKAKEQASDLNHSVEREMGFLAVHGYLHVIGYDHQTKEDEEVMIKLQNEILDKANLKRK